MAQLKQSASDLRKPWTPPERLATRLGVSQNHGFMGARSKLKRHSFQLTESTFGWDNHASSTKQITCQISTRNEFDMLFRRRNHLLALFIASPPSFNFVPAHAPRLVHCRGSLQIILASMDTAQPKAKLPADFSRPQKVFSKLSENPSEKRPNPRVYPFRVEIGCPPCSIAA